MTGLVLADAAPSGAGLAIVLVILLAFAAIALGTVALVVWLIARRVRRNRAASATPPAPGWPAPPP